MRSPSAGLTSIASRDDVLGQGTRLVQVPVCVCGDDLFLIDESVLNRHQPE
jgi:hypothetical protein